MTTDLIPTPDARGFFSDADQDRQRRYAEALGFYEGGQWQGRAQRGEVRLTVNYARALVRKVASYVCAGPVTFSVPAEARLGEAANRAELALAEVVANNDLDWLDAELCTRAGVLGDAAVKVTWDPRAAAPVVTAVDPGTLSIRTAPDRPRHILEVTQSYHLTVAEAVALFGESEATRLLLAGRAGRPRRAEPVRLDPLRGRGQQPRAGRRLGPVRSGRPRRRLPRAQRPAQRPLPRPGALRGAGCGP